MADADVIALGDQRFLSLTTFRKTGEPVSTPVWIGREGNSLLVTTPTASGKVKRINRTAMIELRPCDRRGRVDEAVPPVAAVAEVLIDEGSRERVADLIRRKYGFEYQVARLLERLTSGRRDRVILRIILT